MSNRNLRVINYVEVERQQIRNTLTQFCRKATNKITDSMTDRQSLAVEDMILKDVGEIFNIIDRRSFDSFNELRVALIPILDKYPKEVTVLSNVINNIAEIKVYVGNRLFLTINYNTYNSAMVYNFAYYL